MTVTKLIEKSLIGGLTLMGLSLFSQPAQAINITFSFGFDDGASTEITKEVNGVTIYLSNLNNTNSITPGRFQTDDDGIYLDVPNASGNQFDIAFSQAVQFISYTVRSTSYITPGETAIFALSNPNGAASTGNNLAQVGTFDFSNQFTLNAGQTSTLTATLSAPNAPLYNTSQIYSITVDATPIPWETDALPVIGSTVLFGAGLWAKNKRTKPLQK